jgi:hypothetical protein
MDEARRILERLDRIDALRAAGADASTLLCELRALVREGEAWVEVEGSAAGQAADLLRGLDEAVGPRSGDVTAAAPEGVVAGSAAL